MVFVYYGVIKDNLPKTYNGVGDSDGAGEGSEIGSGEGFGAGMSVGLCVGEKVGDVDGIDDGTPVAVIETLSMVVLLPSAKMCDAGAKCVHSHVTT